MTGYKTNICRALLLWGALSWRVMAVTAITQSSADDRPGQPSAGGTPHSPFRSISVVNLSPSALYPFGGGCFLASSSSCSISHSNHFYFLCDSFWLAVSICCNSFILQHLQLLKFLFSALFFSYPTPLHISSFPPYFLLLVSHLNTEAFPSSTYLLLMPRFSWLITQFLERLRSSVWALLNRQQVARDEASTVRLIDPRVTDRSWF